MPTNPWFATELDEEIQSSRDLVITDETRAPALLKSQLCWNYFQLSFSKTALLSVLNRDNETMLLEETARRQEGFDKVKHSIFSRDH
jgi:hypothetical protein